MSGSALYRLISIHALREEGDLPHIFCSTLVFYFYPRPPRGGRLWPVTDDPHPTENFYPRPPRGGRQLFRIYRTSRPIFLSTPSARRATTWQNAPGGVAAYFYPRPPRGGRLPAARWVQGGHPHFYPRPPRGGRRYAPFRRHSPFQFLSTPSARRATVTISQCAITH